MLLLLFLHFTSVGAVSLPQCYCTKYLPCTEANPIQKTFPECVDHCKEKHPDPLPPEYLPCLLAFKEELTDTIDCIFEKVGLGCSSNEGNVIKGKNNTELFRESVRHKLGKFMDAVGALWEYKSEAAEKVNRCLLRCFYPGRNVCTISLKCVLYVPSDPEIADQLSSCARDSGIKAKERRRIAQCLALVTKKDDSSHVYSPRDEEPKLEKEKSEEETQKEEKESEDSREESVEVEQETSTSQRPTHKPRRPFHTSKSTAYTAAPVQNPLNIVPVHLGTSQMSSMAESRPNPVPVQGSSVAQAPTEDAYRVAPKPPKYPPRVTLTSQPKGLSVAETEGVRENQGVEKGTQTEPNAIVYPVSPKQSNPTEIASAFSNQGSSAVANQVSAGQEQTPVSNSGTSAVANQIVAGTPDSDQITQTRDPEQTPVSSSGINVHPVSVESGSTSIQNNHGPIENPVGPVEVTTTPSQSAPVAYSIPPVNQNQQPIQPLSNNQGEVKNALQSSSGPEYSRNVQSSNPSSTQIIAGTNNVNQISPNRENIWPTNSNNYAPNPSLVPSTNQVQTGTLPITEAPPTEVKPACASVTEPGDVVIQAEISPPAPVVNQPSQQNVVPNTVKSIVVPATTNLYPQSNPYVSQSIPQI